MVAPRGQAARRRILDATRDVIYEGGLEAFSVEAVATASGAARTTIYRHWPEPKELVIEALMSMSSAFPTPDTGSLATDLEALANSLRPIFSDPRTRRLILDLTRAAGEDPVMERVAQELSRNRQVSTQTILQRAIARGEIDPDIDLEIALHLVEGPILSAVLMQNVPMGDNAFEEMVTRIVRALADWASAPRRVPRESAGSPRRCRW